MAGGIHQVQLVFVTVRPGVGQGNRLAFDGYAPLPLNIHVVQDLILKVPIIHQPDLLNKPIRQSGLAVIDMGNNAKITDKSGLYHKKNNIQKEGFSQGGRKTPKTGKGNV
jgi:hypothetical protein